MTELFDEATAVWLRIVTPERVQLETSAHWVQVPTVEGMLGVWPLHAALISAVTPGEVEYETATGVQHAWVDGGILYIRHGQVVILTGSRDRFLAPGRGTAGWDQVAEDLGETLGLAHGEEGQESSLAPNAKAEPS